jgi:hypothetical protein
MPQVVQIQDREWCVGVGDEATPYGDTWTIPIPEGDFWSLRFRPLVKGDDDLNKFDAPLHDYIPPDRLPDTRRASAREVLTVSRGSRCGSCRFR